MMNETFMMLENKIFIQIGVIVTTHLQRILTVTLDINDEQDRLSYTYVQYITIY